ncbi:MAG: hypothetical protein D6797_00815 [Bdellovibrio sp.]|nr:MAG: hypothetical protein D6797_00815 [Bdellovibrio sp.]
MLFLQSKRVRFGCYCATSGTWSGSCSDGKSFSLSIQGCGSAVLTLGEDSESLNFDRCVAQ